MVFSAFADVTADLEPEAQQVFSRMTSDESGSTGDECCGNEKLLRMIPSYVDFIGLLKYIQKSFL